MQLGFIGTGRMGRPMCENLLERGHQLVAFNRSRPNLEALASMGATIAGSAAEVGRGCEIAMLCLPGPAEVQEVVLGPDGLLEGLHAGQTLIDFSSVDPGTSRKIAGAVGEKGVRFLDAPVSGGTVGAQQATLTIMVGGDQATFDACLPVLQCLGKNITLAGPVGSGSVVKIANQLLVGVTTAAVSEAFVLGTKAGVDPQTMFNILSTGFAGSTILNRHLPNFVFKRDFTAGFALDLLNKDVRLALDLGRQLGVRLLMTAQADQVVQEARNEGLGGNDMSAAILPLERLAGVEVKPAKR